MKAASLAGGRAIERRRLAFAALSATNEAILRSGNAGEMLQKVTEAAVDGGGFLGAAIFRKEDGSARLQIEAGLACRVRRPPRALFNGAPNIERCDKLVQLIAKQKGLSHPVIDANVTLVDELLDKNRKKAAV